MSALKPSKTELRRSIRVLKRALELCGKHERWTKLMLAGCPHGKVMEPTSQHAVRFCFVGAMMRASEEYRLRGPVGLAENHEPYRDFNGVPLTPALDLALAACSFVINDDPAFGLQLREPNFAFTEWLRARENDPDPRSPVFEGHFLSSANDHPDTRHEHVTAGLGAAIGVLQGELESRPSRRPPTTRGGDAS